MTFGERYSPIDNLTTAISLTIGTTTLIFELLQVQRGQKFFSAEFTLLSSHFTIYSSLLIQGGMILPARMAFISRDNRYSESEDSAICIAAAAI